MASIWSGIKPLLTQTKYDLSVHSVKILLPTNQSKSESHPNVTPETQFQPD